MSGALGPGKEFDAIRALVRRWGPLAPGIGDDAAVLDLPAGARLVASTDTSVEGIHFRRDWLTPREIGWRAAAAAISDLAAMAAAPLGMLLALTVPAAWRADLPALGDGLGDAARITGTPILGGDLSSGGELSLTISVLGATAAPLGRAGARAGDRIWVTGTLGGPFAALRDLAAGRTPSAEHRARFAHPEPRLAHARWLTEHGAHAAIDISDGLAADLGHLAAAGSVRITLDLDAVPRCDGVSPREAALSGEEYELAIAAPAGFDARAFQAATGLPLTEVGSVAAGAPEVVALLSGVRVDLPRGYDHFSS